MTKNQFFSDRISKSIMELEKMALKEKGGKKYQIWRVIDHLAEMQRALLVKEKEGDRLKKEIKKRLEYLRGEIEAERISYGEIAELVSLKEYIEKDDVLLLEWAGVPESAK